jgi:hypothetical protein
MIIDRARRFSRSISVAMFLAAWPVAAHAILPTTEAGRLCGGSYVIVGRVLAGSARDCRDLYKGMIQRREIALCEPSHVPQLKIYVAKLLSGANASVNAKPSRVLRLGEVIDAITLPMYNVVLSGEQIATAYVGKEFIMVVHMSEWTMSREPGMRVDLWPMNRMDFVKTTLSKGYADCPAPL